MSASTTQGAHTWLVSEDSAGILPIRAGTASSAAQAWTAAITAGRVALLDGTIRHLAVAVDDGFPTFGYSPGRDRQGRLDSTLVTRELGELLTLTLRDLDRAGLILDLS